MSKAVKERKRQQREKTAEVTRVFNTWGIGIGISLALLESTFLPGYYPDQGVLGDCFLGDSVYTNPKKASNRSKLIPLLAQAMFVSCGI